VNKCKDYSMVFDLSPRKTVAGTLLVFDQSDLMYFQKDFILWFKLSSKLEIN